MSELVKLVDCGASVFIYDYKSREKQNYRFGFERDPILGNITYLQRNLLKNFINDILLPTFCLRIPLKDINLAEERTKEFCLHLKKISGRSSMKYLGVVEAQYKKQLQHAYIHLATDIELQELLALAELDISVNVEHYLEKVWGDNIHFNVPSPRQMIRTFITAYKISLADSHSLKRMFHHNLEYPQELYNTEAEKLSKKLCLMDYPMHHSNQFYDNKLGFVIVNEYSLYDTYININRFS